MPDSHHHDIKIAERFRVLSTLGKGGIGAVYLAHDQVLDRRVAVKMLRVKDPTTDTLLRFQKEAKAIAKLNHGAIMTALDFGVTEDGKPYLVLDYLEGETLDSLLDKRKRLSLDEALIVAIRVCEGLEYAHAAGIIHRDIKPSNIYLVDSEIHFDSVKILDFGLARITLEDQRQTTPGTVMGSPLYMSPEQAKGDSVDERCDVYSLGCVLFQMLSGEPPIAAETAVETLQRKLNEPPPKLLERVFDCKFPSMLEEIVAKCLATDKLQRYSNISVALADLKELNDQLEHGCAEDPAKFADTAYSDEATSSSKKTVIKLASGAVLVVGGALIYYGSMIFQPVDKAQQDIRKNREAPLTRNPVSEMPVDFVYSGALQVDGNEGRFKGIPTEKDTKDLGALMKTKAINTVVFDVVEGELTGDQLEPLVQGGLEVLRVSQATFTPGAIDAISRMHRLREIGFGGSQFQAPLFKNPKSFKSMELVALSTSFIRPDDILLIPQLEHVVALDVGKSHGVTPEFLRSLGQMKSLERLGIGGNEILMDHIKAISEVPKLRLLEFSDLDAVSMAAVFKELKRLPRLHAVTLTDFDLNSHDIDELINLSKIDELKLRNVRGVLAKDWHRVARMPNLHVVELFDVTLDSDEDILAFVYSKNLKKLKTTGLSKIDPKVYSQLSRRGVEVSISE